jgi:hypothetical protein
MRLGDERVVERAMAEAHRGSWARRALGIGGGARAARLLLDLVKTDGPDNDTLLALGLLGDLSAVIPLVDLLDHEPVSAAAAVALNTITGAALCDSTFVPDQFDQDELSVEERHAYERDGTLPTRLGKPYGSWERGPLRDTARWRAWLEENKNRFSRSFRWRMGRPHGPAALFECLISETSPYGIRADTYEEIVVRYELDVPFETDLPVSPQRTFLRRIESWVAQRSGQFEDGRWHFRGRLQS